MTRLLKTLFSGCFLLLIHTAIGQVDTARKFVPKENDAADKKLKKEIQQKQLLEKPIPLKSKTASKDGFKRKTIKKKSGQKRGAKSK